MQAHILSLLTLQSFQIIQILALLHCLLPFRLFGRDISTPPVFLHDILLFFPLNFHTSLCNVFMSVWIDRATVLFQLSLSYLNPAQINAIDLNAGPANMTALMELIVKDYSCSMFFLLFANLSQEKVSTLNFSQKFHADDMEIEGTIFEELFLVRTHGLCKSIY